ncbi:zinc dependent phospholipase C family protein [Paenibacillus foliorum]|nr:zinc dependent phospholipase C family protein [Paenibacillus foliorum]
MIHLSVAVNYMENEDIPAAFLLGNIAPDSIHMRKGTNRDDKRRTHLNVENGANKMDFIHAQYQHHIIQNNDEAWKWFVRGYFAHLLTDYFWVHSVYAQFKEQTSNDQLPPDDVKRAYYTDTDQIDFHIYKTKPWTPEVWTKLIATPIFPFAPYLSADEINFWRLRTIHWFDLLCEEPRITPKYITSSMAEKFISETTCKIKDLITGWDHKLIEQQIG